jgi:hypothetical protein
VSTIGFVFMLLPRESATNAGIDDSVMPKADRRGTPRRAVSDSRAEARADRDAETSSVPLS